MMELHKIVKVALALAMPTSVLLLYWLYTRSAEDDDFFGKQIATSKNTKIEVKVPRKAVGAVIGKQGSNIKQIQRSTGARLHFMDSTEESAVFSTLMISGTYEAAQQAELLIHQTIAHVPEMITEEIEVPQSSVGRIIGKGGSSIRELCQLSGAKIVVSRTESAGKKASVQFRPVRLLGTREQIDKALELLEEKLEEDSSAKVTQSINATNREVRRREKGSLKSSAVAVSEEFWDTASKDATAATVSTETFLTAANNYVEVYVSAVEHPGHFWVQMIGQKSLQLELLQEDITSFACSDRAQAEFAVGAITPGMMVAAQFEDGERTFYRAQVLGELENGKVDLYFVDYGDNTAADRSKIYKLRSDFLSLPRQAVECQLAHVTPVGGAWSDEGITLFEDLAYCAQWKPIFAKSVTYGEGDGQTLRPHLQLFDTTGPQDVDIGQELIRHGFALPLHSS